MKKNTVAKLLALSAASIITSSVAHAATLPIQNFSFEDTANSDGLGNSWYNATTGQTVYWGNPDMAIQAWTPGTTGDHSAGSYLVNLPGTMSAGNQEVSSTMWYGEAVAKRTYSGTDIGAFAANSTYTLKLAVQVTNVTGRITLNLLDRTTSAIVGSSSVTLSSGSGWQDLTVTASSGYTVGDQIGISFSFDNAGYPSSGAQFGADNVRLDVHATTTLPIENSSFEDTAHSDGLPNSWYNAALGQTVYWGNPDMAIQAWMASTTGFPDAGSYLTNLPGTMADGNQKVAATMWYGAGNVATRTYWGTDIGTFAADSTYTLKLAVQVTQATGLITLNLLDRTTSAIVGTSSVTLSSGSGWQDLIVTASSGYTVGDQIGISFSFDDTPAGNNSGAQFGADNVRLNVQVGSSGMTAYSAWASTFTGFTDTEPTHDPDVDGMTNQQEFAYGLDPTSGASNNPITAQLDKGSGTFSYTRRDPQATTGATGLTYKIYTSPDLQTWTLDGGATQTVTATLNDVQTVRVILSGLPITTPKLFVRVAAE